MKEINEQQKEEITALVRQITQTAHQQLAALNVRYVLCFAQEDGSCGVMSNLDHDQQISLMQHIIEHASADGDIDINAFLN